MKVEHIEYFIVLVIVCIQLYIFWRTMTQIRLYRNIIPAENALYVSKLFVPVMTLETLSPKEILAHRDKYRVDYFSSQYSQNEQEADGSDSRRIVYLERKEISIIESNAVLNEVFVRILYAINNYLIRNSGASSDFNLIKDVVERNTSVVEEDINQSVGVPLYLGLMSTMLGIVIALFNMPKLGGSIDVNASGAMLDAGIGSLIGGVKIAMIASFVGLLCTIIHSGWLFKGARSFNESRKNDLYTFIQIQLLPIINQGLANTLDSLQRNLMKFNTEFTANLGKLNGIFDNNRLAIQEQKELLQMLDDGKVADMAKFNIHVLKQLTLSVEQFEKFNQYLTNVNQFVDNSQQMVGKTNELLARTGDFKVIADTIDNRLHQSQQLLDFLSEHFNKLEQQKEFAANAVADVSYHITDTFQELKQHIIKSSDAVKQFTVDETEVLKSAMSASRTNLGNLEHLQTLKSDVILFKNSSASQGERLKQALDDMNKNMAKTLVVLEQIQKNSEKGVIHSIKKLFGSGKS
ncbi:hypothetical protein SAMN05661012_05391 [Chitinophaga sancti]|uniref:MotA/TolQ/ExbB proton channel family protein n=2 Tax=Chitinophaga sancti TaxID=1004 RepID=A0A1K1SGY3_9BACT|nr:hypothetical protein SAMN05661012_05391 [Chitinophaga sancti]